MTFQNENERGCDGDCLKIAAAVLVVLLVSGLSYCAIHVSKDAQDAAIVAPYIEAHEAAVDEVVTIQGATAPAPQPKSVARATTPRARAASPGARGAEKAAYEKASFNAMKVSCLRLAVDLKIAADIHNGAIQDAGNILTDYDFCDSPQGFEVVKDLKKLFESKGIVVQ